MPWTQGSAKVSFCQSSALIPLGSHGQHRQGHFRPISSVGILGVRCCRLQIQTRCDSWEKRRQCSRRRPDCHGRQTLPTWSANYSSWQRQCALQTHVGSSQHLPQQGTKSRHAQETDWARPKGRLLCDWRHQQQLRQTHPSLHLHQPRIVRAHHTHLPRLGIQQGPLCSPWLGGGIVQSRWQEAWFQGLQWQDTAYHGRQVWGIGSDGRPWTGRKTQKAV